MAYLTPFNQQRAGDKAQALPTVKEFDEFEKAWPAVARHVSWLDVAAIPWNGNELWRQHQLYVYQHICAQDKLHRAANRDRSLDEFFGGECVEAFWAPRPIRWRVYSVDSTAIMDKLPHLPVPARSCLS